MKKLKELLKTDIYGEPVYGQHVNLLHQKMTADDDDDEYFFSFLHNMREAGCAQRDVPCYVWRVIYGTSLPG